MDTKEWMSKVRLTEEVPGVPESEQYYIWDGNKVIWRGPTKVAGELWAKENGHTIELFEPFEP